MILLASPSKILCQRWREALAGISPIHQNTDKRTVLQSLRELKPRILLLDFDNRQFGTLRSLREIIQTNPSTRVIVFTKKVTAKDAITAMKLGAKGYGPMSRNRNFVRKAVHMVSAGEIWIRRQLAAVLIEELVNLHRGRGRPDLKSQDRRLLHKRLDQLSTREGEVAALIATGEHNRAISSQLGISEKTVKAHLTTIFKKLGISGRTQLALFVSERRPSQKDSPPRYPASL
jgi:two-component system nitrate/nitrite response regulator NarL